MILTVIGGTCSGKTQFALMCEKRGFNKVITNTTRPRRIDDKENSYHFLTENEFKDKIERGEMIEYIKYNGNYYGTSTDSLTDNCIVVLDTKGYKFIKELYPNKVFGVFLYVDDDIRLQRGISRGDDLETIQARIEEDKEVFPRSLESEIDLTLINADYEIMRKVIEKNLKNWLT